MYGKGFNIQKLTGYIDFKLIILGKYKINHKNATEIIIPFTSFFFAFLVPVFSALE